ncbi:SDR family NAD(P)-dependent oxidoreductase [Streptomyces sp. NBC_01198]|uniref:SDR family NAD(P)-dependent oxidoreductase n=1 Tax=Streptomyces sp. NBC_01198 TaxID=2903769 RepID=UPI002E157355|nr:SDR family NAD(P)-dependent oxidoreductase [Streptomyces sp. NBC_01198]
MTDSTPAAARVTTPFTAASTAAEVVAGTDLAGRRAVVTGGASGIGIETARALASAGAEVTIAARDTAAGARVAADLTRSTGHPVLSAPLDLTDPASVEAFTAAWRGPLHVLVNNAGVMLTSELRTPQGWELQFATNHLGHFALAAGLHPALAAAGGARVVALTSVAHLRSAVDFDDIHFERRAYDASVAYAQSKTANVLFAVEADRRWHDDGISANAVHPGAILETGLTRHMDPEELSQAVGQGGYAFKSPGQGAATSVLVAVSPLLDGVAGGRYFEDCNEALPHTDGMSGGVAAHALDPAAAARLWQVSLDSLAAARG